MVISGLSSDNRRFLEIEVGNVPHLKFLHVHDVQASLLDKDLRYFAHELLLKRSDVMDVVVCLGLVGRS